MTEKEYKPLRIEDIPKEAVQGMKRRHITFACEYFQTDNSTKSAINAGSSPRSARTYGYRLLKRDDVQKLLDYLGKHTIQNAGVDPEWILDRLKKVAEHGVNKEEILGPGGRATGRFKMVDTTAACRALELLGKYQNMWGGDLVQVESTTQVAVLGSGGGMDADAWERLASRYVGREDGKKKAAP